VQPIKKLPINLLLAFIVLNFVSVYLSTLIFRTTWIADIQRNTSGWVDPNLVTFSLLNIVLVLGLLVFAGKLRALDMGLVKIYQGFLALAGIWIFSQLFTSMVVLAAGQELALHQMWLQHPSGYIFGFLIAMIIGTALYEEIAFRGVIFPQLFFRFSNSNKSYGFSIFLAILVSSVLFSLFHIPSLILIQGLGAREILISLVGFLVPGFILSIAYLRTGSLFIPIAIHALNNAPTPLLQSPLNPSLAIQVAGLLFIIIWPLITKKKFGFFYTINALKPQNL
jgi:membrane protease YdiL (CAAX protease family)